MARKTLDEIFQEQNKNQFSIGETLTNVPSSAGRLVKDVAGVIRHPIQTVKNIGGVAAGGVQKLIPGQRGQEELFNKTVDFFKNRYGNKQALLNTIEQDPVGFIADVAGVFTAGGAALRGTRLGATASSVGRAIEPLGVATRAVSATTRGLGNLGSLSLGISTGQGANAIRSAFRAAETGGQAAIEFRGALRGKIVPENILTVARDGLDNLKEQRSSQYIVEFAKIKNLKQSLDVSSVRNSIDEGLKNFNIQRTKGGFDFSNSVIYDKVEARRIGQFIDETEKWIKSKNSPVDLDTLKKRLDDFYTPSAKGRALTNSIRKSVETTIKSQVPEYGKMTAEYQKVSNLINEIESSLSLGKNTSIDRSIRALLNAIRNDPGIKQALIKKIDDLTPANLEAQLSGASLSPGLPSGLIGRSIFAGSLGGGALSLTASTGFLPQLLTGLIVSSPRIVGELLNALGATKKVANDVIRNMEKTGAFKPASRVGATQAGRLNQEGRKSLEEIFNFTEPSTPLD